MSKKKVKTSASEKKKPFCSKVKIISALTMVVTLIGGILFKIFSKSKQRESDDLIDQIKVDMSDLSYMFHKPDFLKNEFKMKQNLSQISVVQRTT